MKKGQMIGQIFVFLLAAVVFMLIIFYGYKAIFGFQETQEEVSLVNLQSDLKNVVKTMSADYGSVRKKEFRLQGYEKICFIDLEKREQAAAGLIGYPIIANALEEETDQNVFLVPMAKTEIEIGKIKLKNKNKYDEPFLCLPIERGRISLMFEGLGKYVGISPENE